MASPDDSFLSFEFRLGLDATILKIAKDKVQGKEAQI